jgi:NADH-quinone oxidoreductase subunit E
MANGCNADCKARNFAKVCEIIESCDRERSKLIYILQEVQKIYRYLPEEVMSFVATSLDMPAAKVFGVATFYSNFALEPKGKYVINVCDGTACHVKGSIDLLDVLQEKLALSKAKPTTDDMMFTVETVSCIGACGLAPAITINGQVHGLLSSEDVIGLVDEIVEKENA